MRAHPPRRPVGTLVGALVAVLAVTMVAACAHSSGAVWSDPRPVASASATPTPTPTPTLRPGPSLTPTPSAVPSYPRNGPGTYVFADGQSAVFGTAGAVRYYRVAVETGVPVSPADFAAVVDATLSDERSWIGGHNVRLQRVPKGASSSFTVYLVTPGTAQSLCLAGGFDIFWHGEPYSSCSLGGRVLINLSRYLKAIPNYGAPLLNYQQYAINHEVGHALGHGHELCPGTGKLAPVMQQQTFGLRGCLANSWPYLNGQRYSGPPGTIHPMDN